MRSSKSIHGISRCCCEPFSEFIKSAIRVCVKWGAKIHARREGNENVNVKIQRAVKTPFVKRRIL